MHTVATTSTNASPTYAARDRHIRRRANRRLVGAVSFRGLHKRAGYQQARDWCAATGDVGALARVLGVRA